MKNKKKRKVYHKVVTMKGDGGTFAEFGLVENSTFRNDIYVKIKTAHKKSKNILSESTNEMRVDEALLLQQALSAVIRRKLTGINLILEEVVK